MSRSRNLADLLESDGDVKSAHLDNTTSVTVTDNVTSTSTTEALSANQGKTLKDLVDGKQASDADLTTLATNGIGTSANQLVQLDGSAKLPAVDGSNLTGIDALPTQTSQSGKFLTTNGSAASWGEAGGGKVLQVVSDYQASSSASSSSTTYVDTDLSATITPESTNSRILIFFTVNLKVSHYADTYIRLISDGTSLANDWTSQATSVGGQTQRPLSGTTIDSPSTTAAITYKVEAKTDSSGVPVRYHTGGSNELILMEIGG